MSITYYCLLGLGPTETSLSREEFAALKAGYLAAKQDMAFPRLGCVKRSGLDGLGRGVTKQLREGFAWISSALPSRPLILWLVYYDMTGICRLIAQGGTIQNEMITVEAGEYVEDFMGNKLLAHYPLGALQIRRGVTHALEPEAEIETGSGCDSSDSSDDQ
jgi:hypothetical protein